MGIGRNLVSLGAMVLLLGLATAKHWKVTGKGRITCDGEPMVGIRVRLMDDDLLFDDKLGVSMTDSNGVFRVKGQGKDFIRGKPDPYIVVEYDGETVNGRLKIEKALNTIRKHKFKSQSYKRKINFGHLVINDINCQAYVQFMKALTAFKHLTGARPPYEALHVRTEANIEDGRAWSSTDTVRIPKGYKEISPYLAHHEFAYTIRDSYEGGYLTFLRDAVKYGYSQAHDCHTKTNQGFAFTEGWAKFWASEAVGGSQCRQKTGYGKSRWDYTYEGNVEQAFNRIKRRCKATMYEMVQVLKRSKGRIHNLKDYRKRFRKMYNC